MQFVSSMECIQNNRHSNKQTADHGRNPLTGGSLANATAIRSPPGSHHFIPIDPLPFPALVWDYDNEPATIISLKRWITPTWGRVDEGEKRAHGHPVVQEVPPKAVCWV